MYHLKNFFLVSIAALSVTINPALTQALDFNSLQLVSTRPLASSNYLTFFGNPNDQQGYNSYFNLDTNASDAGHFALSNSAPAFPFNRIPYYAVGRPTGPEDPPSGATRSASLQNITGLTNLFNYLNAQNLETSKIGFDFGLRNGRNVTQAWNLGKDQLGKDWLGSFSSTVEERIYKANPNDVEIDLLYGNTKIINFGYTNIYNVYDFGLTSDPSDNFLVSLSDPVLPTKVLGLDPVLSGLADAFLTDVQSAGGYLQIVEELSGLQGVELEKFSTGNGYGILTVPFPFQLRAVSVPEPGSVIALLCFSILGIISRHKEL